MTAVVLRRAEKGVASEWTLYTWDAPDGTRWAARPETHPETGARAERRYGWAIMQEDRWGGYVIVDAVARLTDVRSSLADPAWRKRHGLNDPKIVKPETKTFDRDARRRGDPGLGPARRHARVRRVAARRQGSERHPTYEALR